MAQWLAAAALVLALVGCGSGGGGAQEPVPVDQRAELPAAEKGQPLDIYIVAGQSNAAGRAAVADAGPEYARADEPFYIWNADRAEAIEFGENHHAGTDTPPEKFGPGIAAGVARLAANDPTPFLLVQWARGGTRLAMQWDPTDPGVNLYDELLVAVDAAVEHVKGKGYAPRFAGFLWMQGEGDASGKYGGGPALYYADYLTELIEGVRASFGPMPVAIARVKFGPSRIGDFPAEGDLRAAQDAVALGLADVMIIDTATFPQFDDLHFDAAGQTALGRAFYDAVK